MVLVGAGLASPAFACRIRTIQPQTLRDYPVAVVATIRSAERNETPGWNSWRLEAEERLPADSPATPRHYVFTSSMSSSGCGESSSPLGEAWVVYLAAPDAAETLDAWPLSFARTFDSRLTDAE